MHILVSNDDGYQAQGLVTLSEKLRGIGQVTVVAPERDRSGASNSLTLDSPLRVRRHGDGVHSVDGTPTDCVHLAITGLLDSEPDIVVSGINAGANLGDDVIYSGTVAAATEGRFLGLPSIAVSLAGQRLQYFDTAAILVSRLVQQLQPETVPANTILNINVPDLPIGEISGIKITRLGHRHKAEPVIRERDPRGRLIYWVGPPGAEQDAGEGTDFDAIRKGFVSITPLQVDLTRHSAIDDIQNVFSKLELL